MTPGLPLALTPGHPLGLTPGFSFGPHPCNSLCLGREPKARVATQIVTTLIKNSFTHTSPTIQTKYALKAIDIDFNTTNKLSS